MSTADAEPDATEVFKALGDPIRWTIVKEVAAVDELPCAALEGMLPVSKPTISYHTKILQHAGLLSVRKEGRNYYYTARRDTLQSVLDQIRNVRPGLRAIDDGARGRSGSVVERRTPHQGRRTSGGEDLVVLTW